MNDTAKAKTLDDMLPGSSVIVKAGTMLAGAVSGLYLGPEVFGAVSSAATYAAQVGGMAIGGLAALVAGTVGYNGADHLVQKFPTTWYQTAGGGLLAVGAGMALASYGWIPALIGAGIAYVAGTGVGKFIYNKAPQTGEFIKGLYEGTGLKTAYNAIAEPVIGLKEGAVKKYEAFTAGVKKFFDFHWGPKPAH